MRVYHLTFITMMAAGQIGCSFHAPVNGVQHHFGYVQTLAHPAGATAELSAQQTKTLGYWHDAQGAGLGWSSNYRLTIPASCHLVILLDSPAQTEAVRSLIVELEHEGIELCSADLPS